MKNLEMREEWVDQTKRIPVMLQRVFLILCVLIVFALPAGAAQQNKPTKGPKPVGAVNSSNGGAYEKGQYGIIFKSGYST